MYNQEYDKKICAWLVANRATILDNWMTMIRIPSVRGEAAPKAPFGIECAKAVKTAAGIRLLSFLILRSGNRSREYLQGLSW